MEREGEHRVQLLFGGKSKVIDLYPEADCGRIFEPFAGSARYALKYYDREVWVNDVYPAVYLAWKFLVGATKRDIDDLPNLKVGESLKDIKYLTEEERCLLGFVVNQGAATPHYVLTHRARHDIARLKSRMAKYVGRISHWKVTNLLYEELPNKRGTWFVDPPYQHMGDRYVHGAAGIDFDHLGEWCRSRRGQVIVCEGKDADWLPFVPLFRVPKNVMQAKKRKEEDKRYYEELIWHRQDRPSGFGFNLQ